MPNLSCLGVSDKTIQAILSHADRSGHCTRLLTIMEAAEPPVIRLTWVADVKGREYLEAVGLCDR